MTLKVLPVNYEAMEDMLISEDKIKIIKHCWKSLLYYDEVLWIKKKGVNGNFDNPIEAYDNLWIGRLLAVKQQYKFPLQPWLLLSCLL